MAVSFGTRIDDDTNFITEVDTEKKIAKTRGNIAGETFVSSGGKLELVEGELSASYNQLVDMVDNGIIPYYFTNSKLHYLTCLKAVDEYAAWFSTAATTSTVGSSVFFNADPDANMLID